MFEPLGSKHSTSQRSSPVPSNGSAGPYCQHTARPTQEAANTVLAFSLVIPAYNESQRLPPYLETIRSYLSEIHADQYEVIVVDDGSSDHLGDVLAEAFPAWEQIRVLRHPQNMGKGAAVRTGVVAARGSRFLFADADGATPIEETQKLCAALDAGADLAVGSRLLSTDQVTRQRTWRRALIGRTFATLVGWLTSAPVRDTQCGFKMFRSGPGKRLFELSQETGYLLDLEILCLAQRCGYQVAEVPVNWSDQPGSRLNMGREWPRILTDLWRVRRRVARMALDCDEG